MWSTVKTRALGTFSSFSAFNTFSILNISFFILFFAGLQEMMYPRYNNPKDALGAFPTLMWSITLIFLSSRRLVRRFARPFFD